MTPPEEDSIKELSPLLGISSEYYDMWGRLHSVSQETERLIISAMGVKDPARKLAELRARPWNRFTEPVKVVRSGGGPEAVELHFPLDTGFEPEVSLSWELFSEDWSLIQEGRIRGIEVISSALVEGRRRVKTSLPIQSGLGMGYYSLDVSMRSPSGNMSGRTKLVVAPPHCHMPEGRHWGLMTNLYALHSHARPVGDAGALKELIKGLAPLGASFVGINPLHSISNEFPYGISPYSARSRLYRNLIYADLFAVPELRGRKFDAPFDAGGLIDYPKEAARKEKALREAFRAFKKRHLEPLTKRGREFLAYVKSEGKSLRDFCLFRAIERRHPGVYDWRDWPEGLRHPDSPDAVEFGKENKDDIDYEAYVQWVLDLQFKDAADEARKSGMKVGIYNDLALGSAGFGPDAWSFQDVFGLGISAGAPPDDFNQKGQKWGVLPMIPERLRETGYDVFIKTLRHNLRHAGALRIDHALGLFRLFWVPDGMEAGGGAYVRYPHEEMLAIAALESARAGAAIVAEDLGTVESGVRAALREKKMLSYRLFYFERRWPERDFLRPDEYPRESLASVTTHDLPTLRGYYEGSDIKVKKELGVYPDKDSEDRDSSEREADRRLMLKALSGMMPEDGDLDERLLLGVYRFIGRTRSVLAAVSLDDLLMLTGQQNLPGTVDEHPNWRQREPVSLKEIIESPMLKNVSEIMKEEGRGG